MGGDGGGEESILRIAVTAAVCGEEARRRSSVPEDAVVTVAAPCTVGGPLFMNLGLMRYWGVTDLRCSAVPGEPEVAASHGTGETSVEEIY